MRSNLYKQLSKAFSGAGSHDLSVTDWQQSLFWAFTGIFAVGACISSINQRVTAEYGRLELQQKRHELLQEVLRMQQQAAAQQQQVDDFEAVLTGRDGSSTGKHRQSWTTLKDQLLSALTG